MVGKIWLWRYLNSTEPKMSNGFYKRNSRELAAAMESLGYTRKNFSNKRLKGWHYVKPDASTIIPFYPGMLQDIHRDGIQRNISRLRGESAIDLEV